MSWYHKTCGEANSRASNSNDLTSPALKIFCDALSDVVRPRGSETGESYSYRYSELEANENVAGEPFQRLIRVGGATHLPRVSRYGGGLGRTLGFPVRAGLAHHPQRSTPC
ncbi:protein of unknown function [Nitrospira japonica]|uniref:Uncharacterized protein n=1 Tax=Nitrospira japonica TaxID=1325564 RepID=A0A1W1I915_9BACT|nr:protein of unknown function [Nitrospira japonica]